MDQLAILRAINYNKYCIITIQTLKQVTKMMKLVRKTALIECELFNI